MNKVYCAATLFSSLVMCLFLVTPSHALVLDFEGLGNQDQVLDFYNGGTSSMGYSGTDYGVSFSDNALSLIDSDAGGSGNFGNEPSPDTILFFLNGDAAVMSLAAGFDTGFSFFYSAISNPGQVSVWSGLGGTGDLLATLDLAITPQDGGDPNGSFSPFVPIGVGFEGTAYSVSFAGVINQIGFDDITFGAVTPGDPGAPVPEPGSFILMGIGLLGFLAYARKRRNA
ncbi:PEP-CTERM sorting domain-containing protein [Desulfovibrio sp. Fe33]|uniref:PEP-CTERM sorting domain-containing protein n=1 Tax=Desulfovibrio sp. Fe33 TaxID=3020842 RepID=UPI00234C1690|nr:PEP-CTERM sorting domain-containing protein [Desulfovibrio sp. Fe33]